MVRISPAAISSRIMNLVIWKLPILGKWRTTSSLNNDVKNSNAGESITCSLGSCAIRRPAPSRFGGRGRPAHQQQRDLQRERDQIRDQQPGPETTLVKETNIAPQPPGRQQDHEQPHAGAAHDCGELLFWGLLQGSL